MPLNVASFCLVSSHGGLVTFPKFMASNSFDVDQILEVVLRDGSDLEDKERWEVCFEDQAWIIEDYLLSTDQANDLQSLNDVPSQVGSFAEKSVRS